MYLKPDFATRNLFNPAIAFVTGTLGVSMRGSRILAVRGRKSGEWRTTPVNPLTLDGQRYLVAPRGDTHWVRNIRVSGEGELRKGRGKEAIRVVEVADEEKVPILRAYLKAWAMETKKFFGLAGPDVTDEEISAIAANHPVFRIV
ncbi:MAG TPA: nitroreductase/quinone reductase family protein [Tepidiformaceae bacterium]|nr:nitroreductase/quinone reductase family protein [Tepidiformaceae bacterium]HMO96123.1 nitroreductase/quinone reductase family protein [Tepidiformaceae bacterium]